MRGGMNALRITSRNHNERPMPMREREQRTGESKINGTGKEKEINNHKENLQQARQCICRERNEKSRVAKLRSRQCQCSHEQRQSKVRGCEPPTGKRVGWREARQNFNLTLAAFCSQAEQSVADSWARSSGASTATEFSRVRIRFAGRSSCARPHKISRDSGATGTCRRAPIENV